jgi:2',3'-cyclic-nucleotide 2'-phosphodiesterase
LATNILFIGEIVGKAGVYCVKEELTKIKDEYKIDFVIANGDGTTGGFGIGKNHSVYLRKLGIDVITGGDCTYYKKDMVTHIEKAPYILRPANYPPKTPGRGWRTYPAGDKQIGVINLLGQSGFNRTHLSNPFTYLPELVSKIRQTTKIILVDFHATTTAEKYTMFYHAEGMVSAVIGTHGRVITSDEKIMEGGTAVICNAGRTGSQNSVGGLDKSIEIKKFLTQIPERSQDSWELPELQGVVIGVDDEGKAESIVRIKRTCKNPESEKS